MSIGLQQDGRTTWLGSRERDGCGWRKIGLFGEPSGHLLADMLMMIKEKLNVGKFTFILILFDYE